MRDVSQDYINAVYSSKVVRSTITGQLVTTDGVVYAIGDADIIGSLSINNKCTNGNSFEFGSVFQGELMVTLKKDFDRYAIKDAAISFTEHRILSDGRVEDIQTGTFYVSEPTRSRKLVTIKAVDRMDSLDIDLEDTVIGTVYELLAVVSEKSGIPLAQTNEQIEAFPNGSRLFSAYADTVGTYRDMVAYLGMVIGAFATINEKNELELRAYSLANNIEIPKSKRNNTSISDYETYYRGVGARFIADQNYAPYEYIDSAMESGLILDLGDIPIVRGLPETKNGILAELFAYIKEIRYTPATFTLITSDLALELGDKVLLSGENTAVSYITGFTWAYHGSEAVKGVGDNPKIRVKDTQRKQLVNLEESINAKAITVNSYTNARDYIVGGDKETDIILFIIAAVEDTKPILMATVPLEMDMDGYVTFNYRIDSVLTVEDALTQYLSKGKHFVTFTNNFTVQKNRRVSLTVSAVTSYLESDIRKQQAKLVSIDNFISGLRAVAPASVPSEEDTLAGLIGDVGGNAQVINNIIGTLYEEIPVDTTVPKATIKRGAIKAVLYAQGLAGKEKWDGTLAFEEFMGGYIPLGGVAVTKDFAVDMDTQTVEYGSPGFAESFGTIALGGITVAKDMAAEYSITTQDVEAGG